MPRWLLTPRWAGLLVLLLVIVAACAWLGWWQWQQARVEVVRNPPSGVEPLQEVQDPDDAVDPADAGRRVEVDGTFDPDRQVVVIDRRQDGSVGSWVVTAFIVTDAADAQSVTIPVVRGWLPASDEAPAPPRGEQHIVGWLEPSEATGLRDPGRAQLAVGEVEIVSTPELLSLWRPPLYEGFVIQQEPPATDPLENVTPPERVAVHTDWQNLAYAIQWWLFGLFAIFWFGRMIRLEAEDRRRPPGQEQSPDLARMETLNDTDGQPAAEKGSQ